MHFCGKKLKSKSRSKEDFTTKFSFQNPTIQNIKVDNKVSTFFYNLYSTRKSLFCTGKLTEYLPGAYRLWEYGFPARLHGDRDGDEGAINVIRGDNSAHSAALSSSKCSKMSR